MGKNETEPEVNPEGSAVQKFLENPPDDKVNNYTWKTKLTGYMLVVETLLLILFAIDIQCNGIICKPSIKEVFFYAIAGGLGGTVYCMRIYYQAIMNKTYDDRNFWYCLMRPIISMICAVFAIFMIDGGIIRLDSTTSNPNQLKLYISISFIVGIVFSRFLDMIDKLASIIFIGKQDSAPAPNKPKE
jgi:hypothetical protein